MTSREKFEAWYLENWGHTEDDHETMFERDPDSNEEYYRLGVRMAHGAWKASELASQQKLIDMAVQLANAESKCRELAAENSGLKAAFDKPQAYLSWHAIPPTWEDPLPCGEYLDVHDETGHKNSDGTDCWPVFAKPEIETPATDAFLAEVRASGVDALVERRLTAARLAKEAGHEITARDLEDEAIRARFFAVEIRKGVQS
ncbi:hypothetical protein [Citrobacter freundii]|uniref:hypothetical protein n=1 Tax=Citrobacter freundii TaxID=546 RepID=UPI002016C947|nr:hypothetical protein [Citrobacter freundii]